MAGSFGPSDNPLSPMAAAGSFEDDENEGGMLLDPPDPLDLLIAHTENNQVQKARPLDFVRAKFLEVKKDNKRLKERVADLEQTLSIVQTAQEWAVGKGMTPEQKEKMREIKALLEQAKKAREDIQKFSGASRQGLFEQLRSTKAALKTAKEEKQEMKDRLLHAFDHARDIREQHRLLNQTRQAEQEKWQDIVRDMKERHRRELRRLQGDGAVMESDRQDDLSYFGEQVIDGLSSLQQHLATWKEETVDAVIFDDDEVAGVGGGGGGGGSGPYGDEEGLPFDDGMSQGEDDDF